MSETMQTQPAPTQPTPLRQPNPRGAHSYALSGRENRRRHRWWLLALLISIVVGLVTLALAQNRGDDSSTARGGVVVGSIYRPAGDIHAVPLGDRF
jgi:hypothetical protein